MSRSEPVNINSPAVRFFEWGAEQGELRYYDKELKENVIVKLPFSFLILDEVSQVGGGIKIQGKYEGYWSNAVKNLSTQIITVKSKQGVVAQGLYAELKERKGLHYVKGLYIAFQLNDTFTIGYLKFKGSSLGAWFEFAKSCRDIYKGAFSIKSRSEVIKGDKGDYYTPVFVHKEVISEESDVAAKELDKVVQGYFASYFAYKETGESDEYTGGDRIAEAEKAVGQSAGKAFYSDPPEMSPTNDDDAPDDDFSW